MRSDGKIKLSCDNTAVPDGQNNIAYRAAVLLKNKFNIKYGVNIRIVKRIPVGAGLGGGSSNAAHVLLGLNRLWNLKLGKEKLAGLAKALGSDVAFFIHNCPFAKGEGRGEKISPLNTLNRVRFWHVLVVPKLHVSTPFIYKKWAKFTGSFELTIPGPNVKMLTSALKKKNLSLISPQLYNDLERITLKAYPVVRRVKEELAVLGLKAILMSGSGPAVFGICSSRKEAVFLSSRLKKKHASWWIFIVRTF